MASPITLIRAVEGPFEERGANEARFRSQVQTILRRQDADLRATEARLEALETRIAAIEAVNADHEARITALEP